MKLILEDLISNIDFNSLSDEYRNFWLDKSKIDPYNFFSNNKNLFDYQEKALENAMILLCSFFKDYDNFSYDDLKKRQYDKIKLELWEDLVKDLDIVSKNNKDRDILNILEEYFEVELDERNSRWSIVERVSFQNLVNRISFWMATWSWKSLVIIKLIYFIHKLISLWKIPKKDFLFLAPKPSIIEQIKEHIEEFNYASDVKIKLVELKDFEKEKTNSQVSIFEEIKLFYTKSDLVKDKESDNQLDFKNYENNWNWYIFLDEAHKWDKESSKAQQYYNIMARNWFIFNFSATFVDIRDMATCVYNFNLAQFIRKWYWKNICISNEEYLSFNDKKNKIEDYNNNEKQKIVLKSIINYVLVKKFYEDIKKIDERFYHNPLMITIWSSVYTPWSDIELFFKEIRDIWLWKTSKEVFEECIKDLKNDVKNDLKFIYQNETNINKSLLLDSFDNITIKDIYKYFYNASNSWDIEYVTIVWNDKELLLKLKTWNSPFAIIKIWSISWLEKEKLNWYEKSSLPWSDNTFSNLNNKNSTINLLIGASAFYEGWDSNRPNVINFINIWLSDAKKFVMQSIWRWIRINPILEERKRLWEIYKDLYIKQEDDYIKKLKEILTEEKYLEIKDKWTILETLFLFSTKRDELKSVVEELNNDDINKDSFEILDLFQRNNIKMDLYYPTYKSKSITKDKEKKYRIRPKKLEELKQYVSDKWNLLLLLDNWLSSKNISFLNKILEDESKYFDFNDNVDNTKKIKYLILEILSFFNYRWEEFDDFKLIDWKVDIISFKNIAINISNEKQKEMFKKLIIEKSNEENYNEDDLDKLFDEWKITREEYKLRLKNIGAWDRQLTFSYNEKTIEIKKIANHYYNPILVSQDERIDWIKHIVDVESEVNFLNALEENKDFLDSIFDEWYFCKLDQYLDKAIRIPYLDSNSEKSNFIPDFIFWTKKWDNYSIYFIDPKWVTYSSYQWKIDFYREIFEDIESKKTKIFSKWKYNIQVKLFIYNTSLTSTISNWYERNIKSSIRTIFWDE